MITKGDRDIDKIRQKRKIGLMSDENVTTMLLGSVHRDMKQVTSHHRSNHNVQGSLIVTADKASGCVIIQGRI